MAPLTYIDAVSEALERLRGVGFEHGPRFVNHAPMAAEALAHMGHTDDVPRWVDHNLRTHTYHDVPEARWTIDAADPDDWRSALGDFGRVADWTALFERELDHAPWPQVLARWWPRLLPGMSGVLTHGVIRTAHAVRALSRAVPGEEDRLLGAELAQGLGYWAARYAVHAPGVRPGDADPRTGDGDGAAAALDALVAEYCGVYASVPQRHPVPLIHSITGPAAVRLVLEHLPADQRHVSYLVARDVSATMSGWFSVPAATARSSAAALEEVPDLTEVFATAAGLGDEHAIKLAEAAVRHEALAPDPRHAAAAHAANRGLARFRG
ncbi:hypothetical protein ACFW2X_21150 [Streptomyces antibioticus]|uniref:hypothetical protein n=1 Tax=Streptomyces antibioticus TaxID=1890 RepID=UPI0036C5D773